MKIPKRPADDSGLTPKIRIRKPPKNAPLAYEYPKYPPKATDLPEPSKRRCVVLGFGEVKRMQVHYYWNELHAAWRAWHSHSLIQWCWYMQVPYQKVAQRPDFSPSDKLRATMLGQPATRFAASPLAVSTAHRKLSTSVRTAAANIHRLIQVLTRSVSMNVEVSAGPESVRPRSDLKPSELQAYANVLARIAEVTVTMSTLERAIAPAEDDDVVPVPKLIPPGGPPKIDDGLGKGAKELAGLANRLESKVASPPILQEQNTPPERPV